MNVENVALETQFVALIAGELKCSASQVESASALFAEGATVPFVARYRKEVTGGLDDEQLENLHKRREYFLELAARRDVILASIAEQEKLTPELAEAIAKSHTRQELEDLYLPYRPKRRTRAQIARERGLEPLADALLISASTADLPHNLAATYVDPDKEIEDVETALLGARDILAERMAEDADNRMYLRRTMLDEAILAVQVVSGKEAEGAVYSDYFEHRESASAIPSHRLLAILRGERDGFLISNLDIDDETQTTKLALRWKVPLNTPCGQQLTLATIDGYKRLLRPSITNEVRAEMREKAEMEAIRVFRSNLEALLMQSPFGRYPVIGLDPGERTGCKVAVVDDTSKVIFTTTLYPLPPRADEDGTRRVIAALSSKHSVRAIAIGNGTGSRETERIVRQAIAESQVKDVIVAIVPETGASVYSASAVAREELPGLDVTLRGAVSIARRLQDPLAELVKIEPRSMGVGQYQHDVNQKALGQELDLAVEGVVNKVGVELNMASHSLLRRVSGISARIAKAIVSHREDNGSFSSRKDLLKVKGLGPKTFELSAGFLRIHAAKNPLDRTAVHPERYDLVQKMASELSASIEDLVGNPNLVSKLNFHKFIDESAGIGQFTLNDIRTELQRPGRDPRPEYQAPTWRDDILSIHDLQEDMILEGRVSNVANFGAFVDLGIKRDGLIHISELSHVWLDDPRKIVNVGQIVKVKVIEIDRIRERIGLSLKALQPVPDGYRTESSRTDSSRHAHKSPESRHTAQNRPESNRPTKGSKPSAEQTNQGLGTLGDLLKKFTK
jgi:uncharacterized protein